MDRLGGEPGNAAGEYVMEVQDGTAKRTIAFRPAGKTAIRAQQIMMDTTRFAAEPVRCRASLAG